MRKLSLLFLSFYFLTPLLSGCIDKKILDDVQLATAVGYELDEDDLIKTTVVVPEYKPDKSVKNVTFTTSAKLSKQIRDKLDRKSSKPFVSGKIEVALYGTNLAENGVADLIDTFERDPSVGSRLYLGVSKGDLSESLKIQYGSLDNGMHLSNIIEHNITNGMLPKTNLHQFTRSLYSEGMDPFLPYIEFKENEISIEGIALFQDDKYIDYLNAEDSFIFKMLYEKFSTDASFAVKLGNDKNVSVYNISSKRIIKVKNPMSDPVINIHIKTEAIIREYSDGNMNSKVISNIENKMKKDLETKSRKIIKRFQEYGIDPLGLGKTVKTRTRAWSEHKWDDMYPNCKINVDATVKVSESGVIN